MVEKAASPGVSHPSLPGCDKPVLVTGAAGFIGFHVARRLLQAGIAVTGVDDLTDYYDPALKHARLAELEALPGFSFARIDIANPEAVATLFAREQPRHVVHLAAQAGVRHSISHPQAYARSNLMGFVNILEGCRNAQSAHLVYASSSSVYGGNRTLPFATSDGVDHPVSLYAATKKANEVMAHSYAHLYGLPCTGLRFFTVYGPWGRPDMAYWVFSDAILDGRPISVFNHGRMARDFTFIDDAVDAVVALLPRAPLPDPDRETQAPDPGASWAPYRVYNVGNDRPESLTDMIAILEDVLGRRAIRRLLPMQPGDVVETWADISPLTAAVGYRPRVALREGLQRFADWHRWWRDASAARPARASAAQQAQ